MTGKDASGALRTRAIGALIAVVGLVVAMVLAPAIGAWAESSEALATPDCRAERLEKLTEDELEKASKDCPKQVEKELTKRQAEAAAKAKAEAKAKAKAEAEAEAEAKAAEKAAKKAEAEAEKKAEAETKAAEKAAKKAEAEAEADAKAAEKAAEKAEKKAEKKIEAKDEEKAKADANAPAELESLAAASSVESNLADADANAPAELESLAPASSGEGDQTGADANAPAEVESPAPASSGEENEEDPGEDATPAGPSDDETQTPAAPALGKQAETSQSGSSPSPEDGEDADKPEGPTDSTPSSSPKPQAPALKQASPLLEADSDSDAEAGPPLAAPKPPPDTFDIYYKGGNDNKTGTISLYKNIIDPLSGTVREGALGWPFTVKVKNAEPPSVSVRSGDSITLTNRTGADITVSEDESSKVVSAVCSGHRKTWVPDDIPTSVHAENGFTGANDSDTFSCTFTNKVPSYLTLHKEISENPFGDAKEDYTLAATGSDISGNTGVSGQIAANTTYDLTESGPNLDSYDQSWSCVYTDFDGSTRAGAADGTVKVEPGESADCTVTNTYVPTTLTLKKKMTGDSYGDPRTATDFTLSATYGDQSFSGVTGSDSVDEVPVTPGKPYTLGEAFVSSTADVSEQFTTTWKCKDGATYSGGAATVTRGSNAVCTATNEAIAPELTLAKVVEGAPGVSNQNWTLTAKGGTSEQGSSLSGLSGAVTSTSQKVEIGNYALAESPVEGADTAGFEDGQWACAKTGGPGSITSASGTGGTGTLTGLILGQKVTCTVTNKAKPATLQLVKAFPDPEERHGDTRGPADFTLTADGPTPLSVPGNEKAQTVKPGTYALDESLTGKTITDMYDASWDCAGATMGESDDGKPTVTLKRGENVVCTVTNKPKPPTLTLKKIAKDIDGDEQTDIAEGFTLNATGTTTYSEPPADWQDKTVDAGTYTLSETPGDPNYVQDGPWVCEGGSFEADTSKLTLDLGEVATCTVTNVFTPTSLLLKKAFADDDIGTPSDWAMLATGDDGSEISMPGSEVSPHAAKAGVVYTLTEDSEDSAFYELTGWTCSDDDGEVPVSDSNEDGWKVGPFTAGDNVTCTATNEATTTPRLVLYKKLQIGENLIPAPNWVFEATFAGGASLGTLLPTDDDGTTFVAVAKPSMESIVVSESDLPEGYSLDSASCVRSKQGQDPTSSVPTGSSADSETASVTVDPGFASAGDVIACTIINNAPEPTLTLKKQIVDADGADITSNADQAQAASLFTLSAAAGDDAYTFNGVAPDAKNVKPGSYQLTEDSGGLSRLYQEGGWTCETTSRLGNKEPAELTPDAEGNVSLNIGYEDHVTCTKTNVYNPPHLTLVKQLDDPTGSAALDDWRLTAAPDLGGATAPTGLPEDLAGAFNDISQLGDPANHGSALALANTPYTLSEAPADQADPDNLANTYETVSWQCEGGSEQWSVTGKTLTLSGLQYGDNVTCTVANKAILPTLQLAKTVAAPDGVEAAASADWLLQAAGDAGTPDPVVGSEQPVAIANLVPGTYSLSEAAADPARQAELDAGYQLTGWQCTDAADASVPMAEGAYQPDGAAIALGLGNNIVCTATNEMVLPTLTLQKEAYTSEDEPMPDVAEQFELTAAGPQTLSGPTGSTGNLHPGSYALSESGGDVSYKPAPEGWVCSNETTGAETTGTSIDLAAGDAVTCVIVNKQAPPPPVEDVYGVGNRVWLDSDGNGRLDVGEPGVSGVLVSLLHANGNPVRDANGAAAQQVTAADGQYFFDNVAAGEYQVAFSKLPADTKFTVFQANGVAPGLSSEANPANGVTPVFTLNSTGARMQDVPAAMVSQGVKATKVDLTQNAGILGEFHADVIIVPPGGDGRKPVVAPETQAAVAPGPAVETTDFGSSGVLAASGANVGIALAIVAALLGCGLLLVALRVRSRRHE